MKIADTYEHQLTTQAYGQKPFIEGVEIIELSFHNDDGGNFVELFRLEEGRIAGVKEPFTAKQISASVLTPGTIKAFHIHKKQNDLWYVSPYDRLLVNLRDLREDSPTFNAHVRLVLGGGKNSMLRIPHGVAHGAANAYERNMTLLYATSEQFNPSEPDEHRLPWDAFGAEIWALVKG